MDIPTWIQNILDNPALLNSFREDMERQKHLAEKEGLACIEKSDMVKAQIALGKAKAFDAILFSVNSIIKEREAQDGYMERTKQSKSTKSTRK